VCHRSIQLNKLNRSIQPAESTDGTLTVNSAPSRGCRLHQRKPRAAADRVEVPLLTVLLVLASQALTDLVRKQSCFSTQQIRILWDGMADVAGVVFRDTVSFLPLRFPYFFSLFLPFSISPFTSLCYFSFSAVKWPPQIQLVALGSAVGSPVNTFVSIESPGNACHLCAYNCSDFTG